MESAELLNKTYRITKLEKHVSSGYMIRTNDGDNIKTYNTEESNKSEFSNLDNDRKKQFVAIPITFQYVTEGDMKIFEKKIEGKLFSYHIQYVDKEKLLPAKISTPLDRLHCFVKSYLHNVSAKQEEKLFMDLPKKWETHGDLIMFPDSSFTCKFWDNLPNHFWTCVADIFSVQRIALKSIIRKDIFRTPNVTLRLGTHGWVEHIDNGIKYTYDITKNMFSKGNITEKLRISSFDCRNEVVVDLFAGKYGNDLGRGEV